MTFGELTQILLFEKTNYKALFEGVHTLHDFFASITGVSASNTTDGNIYLPTGKAISPGQAAHCVVDLGRTTAFLRGVHQAILKLQQDFPGKPLHILYAGCGPYATLLTPLTNVFRPDEIRVHLLDINHDSLNAVQKLWKHLQADSFIESVTCADAATYEMPEGIGMVVTEALQQALAKEPQVAITLNLVPQLGPGAVFIPEEIRVSAWLLDGNGELNSFGESAQPAERVFLGAVYVLGRESAFPQEPVSFQLPAGPNGCTELTLMTDITVFGEEKLTTRQCGLTLPVRVMDVAGMAGKSVRFEYEISGSPGFRWEVL